MESSLSSGTLSTRKLRPFSTKNCAVEVVFSVVIRSSKNTGRRPLTTLKVEVFGAYGGRKQDGGEQSFTRLTALASKGSADLLRVYWVGRHPFFFLVKFHVECHQNHVWGCIFGRSYDHIYKNMYFAKVELGDNDG